MPEPKTTRVLQGGLIVVGALAGAVVPFLTREVSSPRFTDIEARLGFGVGAVLMNASFGALGGWPVGALIVHFWRRRQ